MTADVHLSLSQLVDCLSALGAEDLVQEPDPALGRRFTAAAAQLPGAAWHGVLLNSRCVTTSCTGRMLSTSISHQSRTIVMSTCSEFCDDAARFDAMLHWSRTEGHQWASLTVPQTAAATNGSPRRNSSGPLLENFGVPAPALHGLAGDIVRALAPETEADPHGLLFALLTMFGAAVGPGPRMALGPGVWHRPVLFTVLVGDTSKARKSTALRNVADLFEVAQPGFAKQMLSGVGSGEALVDLIDEHSSTPDGAVRGLILQEDEFARIVKVCARENSTYSEVMRSAWDGQPLQAHSRKDGSRRVDRYHVAVLAAITGEQAVKVISDDAMFDGFANRHLFVMVRRARELPRGGRLAENRRNELGSRLREAIEAAASITDMQWSEAAVSRWEAVYGQLAEEDGAGRVGAALARAEAQVLRISMVYTLLDGTATIQPRHLDAAWTLWQYIRESATELWGGVESNSVRDRILRALRVAGPDGCSDTDLIRKLSNRGTKARDRELAQLRDEGVIVQSQHRENGNKPTRRSYLIEYAPPD